MKHKRGRSSINGKAAVARDNVKVPNVRQRHRPPFFRARARVCENRQVKKCLKLD
jgi:hypothetical protein